MKYNNTDNTKELLLEFKHIMLDKGIKQGELAERMHISKQTVSNLLNGKQLNLTLETLVNLCNALDCTLNIDIVQNKDAEQIV